MGTSHSVRRRGRNAEGHTSLKEVALHVVAAACGITMCIGIAEKSIGIAFHPRA